MPGAGGGNVLALSSCGSPPLGRGVGEQRGGGAGAATSYSEEAWGRGSRSGEPPPAAAADNPWARGAGPASGTGVHWPCFKLMGDSFSNQCETRPLCQLNTCYSQLSVPGHKVNFDAFQLSKQSTASGFILLKGDGAARCIYGLKGECGRLPAYAAVLFTGREKCCFIVSFFKSDVYLVF